jgi:hypothetical protein
MIQDTHQFQKKVLAHLKACTIHIIEKYLLARIAARGDVVKSAGKFNA